jgi:hypothetical protein
LGEPRSFVLCMSLHSPAINIIPIQKMLEEQSSDAIIETKRTNAGEGRVSHLGKRGKKVPRVEYLLQSQQLKEGHPHAHQR